MHSVSLDMEVISGMGSMVQAHVLVRPVRPSPGAALWYVSMIVGISIDAWEGF